MHSTHKDVVENASFVKFVPDMLDDRLFMIEPYLLSQAVGSERLSDLSWRFNLPQFAFTNNSITMGMFAHEKVSSIEAYNYI